MRIPECPVGCVLTLLFISSSGLLAYRFFVLAEDYHSSSSSSLSLPDHLVNPWMLHQFLLASKLTGLFHHVSIGGLTFLYNIYRWSCMKLLLISASQGTVRKVSKESKGAQECLGPPGQVGHMHVNGTWQNASEAAGRACQHHCRDTLQHLGQVVEFRGSPS